MTRSRPWRLTVMALSLLAAVSCSSKASDGLLTGPPLGRERWIITNVTASPVLAAGAKSTVEISPTGDVELLNSGGGLTFTFFPSCAYTVSFEGKRTDRDIALTGGAWVSRRGRCQIKYQVILDGTANAAPGSATSMSGIWEVAWEDWNGRYGLVEEGHWTACLVGPDCS